MGYRSIPHSTTGETPADILLRRPLRTRLDLLKPKLTDKASQRQETQKRFHDGAGTKEREFTEGQNVLVENLRGTTPKWISGKIVEKMGPVSYKVEIDGVVHRRCNNRTELVIKESHLRLADYSVLINMLERGINNSVFIGTKQDTERASQHTNTVQQ